MDRDPRDVLLHEFGAYYNADELGFFTHKGFEEQADDSADRMVYILGDRALEVAALMRDVAADPEHPFCQIICDETDYDWDAEPESWEKFQILAQRMSDRITTAINKSGNETSTNNPNSTQEQTSPTPKPNSKPN